MNLSGPRGPWQIGLSIFMRGGGKKIPTKNIIKIYQKFPPIFAKSSSLENVSRLIVFALKGRYEKAPHFLKG